VHRRKLDVFIELLVHNCAGENWWLWIDASITEPVGSLRDDRAEKGSVCVVGTQYYCGIDL